MCIRDSTKGPGPWLSLQGDNLENNSWGSF
jgi:hypothetical protein